ncbi:MAG: thymidylate kinase [Clostridioides sp.]|nr:thymidylate kinase [Clostridioides sp.]
MKGKLIIIESGTDSSGKATQTRKLFERLNKEQINLKKIAFPDYESESSSLVKMYLRGDFGKNPSDVDPYVASTFFAADRYASFKTKWDGFYNSGGLILADRYTTSNMIHQASKMKVSEREKYLDWLYDFEYNMYKIPKPDLVLFLDMPVEKSFELMKNRKNEITGEDKKDIHESNYEYLKECYNTGIEIANKYNWKIIECVQNNKLRTIEDIHEEIYSCVKEML